MTKDDTTPAADPTAVKDPAEWTTGGEPMTGAQESYLGTLARAAGEETPPPDLTKAEASEKIEELREKTGKPPKKKPATRSRKKAAG